MLARIRRTIFLLLALMFVGAQPRGGVARPTGTVEGRLDATAAPPRRVAPRYLGGGAQPHSIQQVPPVVYVENAGSGAPARLAIGQRDTAFTPAVLVVDIGAEVEFPNRDPFFHNVFSYSGAARFDLGRYPRGESRSVRFDEAGVVKIYCEVHDFMRAVVHVVEDPLFAAVDENGRFTIPDVPAGRRTLTAWHPEKGITTMDIDVMAGGTTRVDVRFPR
jgi:plastocyanin